MKCGNIGIMFCLKIASKRGLIIVPNKSAIRLKYGQIGTRVGEYVPHLHQENKTQLSLTEEMTFVGFVDWLKKNIQ